MTVQRAALVNTMLLSLMHRAALVNTMLHVPCSSSSSLRMHVRMMKF
jgi:hypothetical protein